MIWRLSIFLSLSIIQWLSRGKFGESYRFDACFHTKKSWLANRLPNTVSSIHHLRHNTIVQQRQR
jgi:hypothetical protein